MSTLNVEPSARSGSEWFVSVKPQPTVRPQRQVSSATILDGDREVIIAHGEQRYKLRHTFAGKLILTK
jgi:hemin uptake protein HemP